MTHARMILTRTVLATATALTLAACNAAGPSVSGSADEGASSQNGVSSLWERVRGLGVDQSKTTDMPALGLIADAFLKDAGARGVVPARVRTSSMFEVGGKVLRLDQAVDHDVSRFGGAFPPEFQKLTLLDAAHANYAEPILIALAPLNGWEVEPEDDRKLDPVFDNPFFNRNPRRALPRYKPQMHLRYMEMLSIAAIYTNDVFARIAQTLGGVRLADPDDAHNHALAAYQAIPAADLKSMLARAGQQAGSGRFNTDLASANSVHFVHSTAGDFVGDPRGLTWTRAGGTWFGDGRLNGQSVNFRLVSTLTLAQRQAQSGTTSNSADARVGGTANVGPGR